MPNNALTNLTLEQLRRVVSIREQIAALEAEMSRIVGGSGRARGRTTSLAAPGRGRRGQAVGAAVAGRKAKRRFSASTRAKLRAIAKARWAKVKASGKSAL